MNNIFQAVILCGGYGTRIKKYTKYTPKSLIKFFNNNFIEYLIFNLSRFSNKREDHQTQFSMIPIKVMDFRVYQTTSTITCKVAKFKLNVYPCV